MSEPQARSTLGTCCRTSRAPQPIACAWRLALVTLVTLSVIAFALPLDAQIRGGRSPASSRGATWWISGGAGAAIITDINDGRTQSVWHFGGDPKWTARGSIEKALDEFSTIGVAVSYGKVDVSISPFPPPASGVPLMTAASPLPTQCVISCQANVQLWTLMGQFRSGGGTGFHTLFEATGGVTGFRSMRTADSTAAAIGPASGSIDLSGSLGAGFGYPITQGMIVTLVQDFGIGFHSSAALPSGTGRSWRVRTTRASLRFSF